VTGPSAPPIGKTIAGKYEVRGVLGEGGTGVVYDAVQQGSGRAVALKVMHAHLAGDTQIRGRFQREAAILRRLEGPHICPIMEFGEVEEAGKSLLFIALPKLEGVSLEAVLAKESPIEVDRAIDIMLEVCAALRTAHAEGIIHRDLKPANVILGEEGKAYVVDFGMSKIITGAGTGTTQLTAHNMVFGTPEYMSPEQARGDELDARCDVYAAGVMLYEMLTGVHPFTGSTPLVVLTEHLTGELVPPSKRAPEGRVTPALESVVLHALARDRDARYPSASALAAALMHSRAMPADTAALRPEAFGTSPGGTDAFALTMPAIGVPRPVSSSPPKAIVHDVVPTAATLPASSSGAPAPVRAVVTTPPPAATTGSGARPLTPTKSPAKTTSAMWILVWIVAGLASIAIGVWFALR